MYEFCGFILGVPDCQSLAQRYLKKLHSTFLIKISLRTVLR
jgi:hypothetical protein